ncbi:MAG: ABC-2 transporter permease, partial [Solibacillus sp.]
MITMLKLHFYFSRKRLAFIGIFIAATILMFYHYSESFSLNTFLFIFLLQMASFGISLYNENNFIRILRTMPITTKDFITSAYVFTFIFIAVISLPILLHQFYQS